MFTKCFNKEQVEDYRFSVLMPIYIKEKPHFLKAALESILEDQTLLPDEVVIVEDGPITDDLNAVLNEFETKYGDRIKRHALKVNQGMGRAMNYGLHQTTYDWVVRMDSDDVARAHRFESQFNFLKNNPKIDVLGSAIEEFNTSPGDINSARVLPPDHSSIIKFMKKRNPINHMTVAFRKSVALKAGGYWSERYFEDYNLWYEMYKQEAIFHNLSNCLVDVRIGNDMIKRRSGFSYFKYEKLLLDKFLKDNYISFLEYILFATMKFFARILPTSLLRLIYTIFLRKKNL